MLMKRRRKINKTKSFKFDWNEKRREENRKEWNKTSKAMCVVFKKDKLLI